MDYYHNYYQPFLITIIITIVITTVSSSDPLQPPPPPPSTDQQIEGYLTVHNAARAEVGVGPVTWNDTVAEYARGYVGVRAADCAMKHSGGPYGENLAWATWDLSGEEASKMWAREKPDYDYTSNTCLSGVDCLHYTQMVWRGSVRIGCARAKCYNGNTLVACNYDPPGNYVGQRPY